MATLTQAFRRGATFRTLGFLKNKKKIVLVLILFSLLSVTADIYVPLRIQKLIDTLIGFFKSGGAPPIGTLLFSAIAILVASVASRAISSAYNYQLYKTVTKTEDEVECLAFEKYLKLHALFHHNASSGQMISRIERGATAVYTVLNDIFGQSLFPPLMVFTSVMVTLLFYNVWIALIVLLPLPIYLIAIERMTERMYDIETEILDQFEAISKQAYDVAANVLTVKKFSREHAEAEMKIRMRARARSTQYRSGKLWELITGTQTAIAQVGRVAVIVVSGLLVIKGKCTVGDFVLFINLQNMAYGPLSQLSGIVPKLRRNIGRIERLLEVLDEPIRVVDKPGAIKLPRSRDCIEFRGVWFRYSEDKDWALRNINVRIPVGATVALVGRSGSGKTTFINLLMRSFDPQVGALVMDGHDLRDVTQESLHDQIAVVPQEVDLFSRTIAENIVYGRPNASRGDMVRAAKMALSHDFITKTRHGYDTVVGERGLQLSGGQRQRIGIARAILRDPNILILDEATSHLDSESERLIHPATDMAAGARTTFMIAHRLSTVLHADLIMVFNNGEIEAVGTVAELLESSPTFQRLHALQYMEQAEHIDVVPALEELPLPEAAISADRPVASEAEAVREPEAEAAEVISAQQNEPGERAGAAVV